MRVRVFMCVRVNVHRRVYVHVHSYIATFTIKRCVRVFMRLRANVHRRICVHAHMRVSMRVGVNPLHMTAVCQNLLILCFHYHTAN